MAILKMKRLRLLAVRAEREGILRALQLLGCVEISEPAGTGEDVPALLRREAPDLETPRAESEILGAALRVLGDSVPAKAGLLSPPPSTPAAALFDDAELRESLDAARAILDLHSRLEHISGEEAGLRRSIRALSPWKDLDLPAEFTGTRLTDALTGTVPARVRFHELEAAVSAAAEGEAQLFRVSSDRERSYLFLLCMRDRRTAVTERLRGLGFTPADPGAASGTAAGNLADAEVRLVALMEEKAGLRAEMAVLSGHREAMRRSLNRVAAGTARAEAAGRLLYTDAAFALEGWVPAGAEPALGAALAEYDCAWELPDPSPEELEGGEVPVLLKDNALLFPLNRVTEATGLPAYGGADPTPLMAPFFVLLYGMMLPDMGYGLLLLAAGFFAARWPRRGHGAGLLLCCGASATAFGALTGSFFADFLPRLLPLIAPAGTSAWFWKPLFPAPDGLALLLLGGLALGLAHCLTAMTARLASAARAGRNSGRPAAVLRGLRVGATAFLYGIFSYSRLIALMLAGGVLARLLAALGAMSGSAPVFVLAAVVGVGLKLALNLAAFFTGELKLRCFDFPGRLGEGAGRAFRPLTLKTEYVNAVAVKE